MRRNTLKRATVIIGRRKKGNGTSPPPYPSTLHPLARSRGKTEEGLFGMKDVSYVGEDLVMFCRVASSTKYRSHISTYVVTKMKKGWIKSKLLKIL